MSFALAQGKRAEAPTERSLVVGPTRLARMLRRSRGWAQATLLRWHEEQEKGGPRRVHWDSPGSGRKTWVTTVGHVQEAFGIRDSATERRVKDLERDLAFALQRLVWLASRVDVLEKRDRGTPRC